MMPQNHILAALPIDELKRVHAHCERVSVQLGDLIFNPGQPIEYVYFPIDAIISVLSVFTDGTAVETATIGSEGMAGLAVMHGVTSTPEHSFVQLSGDVFRLRTQDFLSVLGESAMLRTYLNRYAQALFTLAAQSSGCNRRHSMVQRCARWMLLVHDRVARKEFMLTQLILSQMLGVRRATVNEAASELADAGAIRYSRGTVTVMDRATLERMSCECYAIIRSAFDAVLTGTPSKSPVDSITLSIDGKSIAGEGS